MQMRGRCASVASVARSSWVLLVHVSELDRGGRVALQCPNYTSPQPRNLAPSYPLACEHDGRVRS